MPRRPVGAVHLLVIAMLLVLAVAAPAEAKGPTKVTIEGAGLTQPIVLGGSSVGILFFESGVADGLGACLAADRYSPHRPQGDLGPKYVATYTVKFPDRSGHMVDNQLVQYLYPQPSPLRSRTSRRASPTAAPAPSGARSGWGRPSLRT